ncbi:uncharacterized protein TNCT_554341 [Trichonephila clavata]|uniref:Gustatory receptor n=1 Tax=Trichonephila clavata TaxID=2740835 RepID=A0A8X6KX72_TRICU|nr:uncharacterized protein TNCT_554341 [Trichonephila clavata]
MRVTFQYEIKNLHYSFSETDYYLMLIVDIDVIAVLMTSSLVLTSLSGYYGFACVQIQYLFNKLETRIENLKNIHNCGQVIYIYQELIRIMKSLDESLSYPAFVIVLSGLLGLFYTNCDLLFVPKEGYLVYICITLGEIYFSVLFVMVILSASAVNNSSATTKERILSLPGKIPRHYNELKMVVRSECMRDVSLTLWKIYKIDRSLLISAMGSLLTYGILVATLGAIKD